MDIFHHKMVSSGDLYVIDDACIYKDFIYKDAVYDGIVKQLESDVSPHQVLSDDHESISFGIITSIKFDVVRLDLDITYPGLNEKGESEEKEVSLLFLDKEAFKLAYHAIKARIGDRLVESTYQPNTAQAAWGGLFTFAVLFFFTLVLKGVAEKMLTETIDVSEEGRITRILFFIVELIGSTGVLVIGGALSLCALVYGITRVTKKSGFRIFQEEVFSPPGIINMSLKYIALFFMLFLSVRLLGA